jgi:hypothetical protein
MSLFLPRISLKNVNTEWGVFHTVAVGDWLAWGNHLLPARTRLHTQLCKHGELAGEITAGNISRSLDLNNQKQPNPPT